MRLDQIKPYEKNAKKHPAKQIKQVADSIKSFGFNQPLVIDKDNEVIFDGFLGSGSTLIASQKTGRICYGMELDPKYVDVIVQRYCDYVGDYKIKKNGKEITWKTN